MRSPDCFVTEISFHIKACSLLARRFCRRCNRALLVGYILSMALFAVAALRSTPVCGRDLRVSRKYWNRYLGRGRFFYPIVWLWNGFHPGLVEMENEEKIECRINKLKNFQSQKLTNSK